VRETVEALTQSGWFVPWFGSRPGRGTFHIEDVQDQVELSLMRGFRAMRWRAPMFCTVSVAPKSVLSSVAEQKPEDNSIIMASDHGEKNSFEFEPLASSH
jgi:hypothetical protein